MELQRAAAGPEPKRYLHVVWEQILSQPGQATAPWTDLATPAQPDHQGQARLPGSHLHSCPTPSPRCGRAGLS